METEISQSATDAFTPLGAEVYGAWCGEPACVIGSSSVPDDVEIADLPIGAAVVREKQAWEDDRFDAMAEDDIEEYQLFVRRAVFGYFDALEAIPQKSYRDSLWHLFRENELTESNPFLTADFGSMLAGDAQKQFRRATSGIEVERSAREKMRSCAEKIKELRQKQALVPSVDTEWRAEIDTEVVRLNRIVLALSKKAAAT